MKKIYVFAAIVISMLVCLPAMSEPVMGPHVVLAGDSMTVAGSLGYADEFLGIFGGMTTVVAEGGIDASGFSGVDPNDSGGRTYPQIVVDANPDFVVFMLGINSALRTTFIESNYDEHRKRIGTAVSNVIFNDFDSLPSNVEVIVLSILPVDESVTGIGAGTNARVDGIPGTVSEEDVSFGYNPFYEAEVQRRNADAVAGPTYRYVDLLDSSQTNTDYSSSFLSTDGLHLNATGQAWLANEVRLQAVPEPSAFMAIGCVAMLGFVIRRASFTS